LEITKEKNTIKESERIILLRRCGASILWSLATCSPWLISLNSFWKSSMLWN